MLLILCVSNCAIANHVVISNWMRIIGLGFFCLRQSIQRARIPRTSTHVLVFNCNNEIEFQRSIDNNISMVLILYFFAPVVLIVACDIAFGALTLALLHLHCWWTHAFRWIQCVHYYSIGGLLGTVYVLRHARNTVHFELNSINFHCQRKKN